MAERKNSAPGFRFYPSAQELISFYLKPRILGHKPFCNIIKDIQLYGPNSTPWQLFDVNDESWTASPDKPLSEKYLYVFTSLSKLRSSKSSKIRRIRENTLKEAGCGTWQGKTKKNQIKDCEGNLIGEQKMLVFEIKDTGDQFDLGKAVHFRMHEYSLAGVNKDLKSADGNDVVLCKITVDFSKEPEYNLGSKSSDHAPTKNTSECQLKVQINEGNLERSVGNNLEETMNSTPTPTSMVEMNSSVGNNVEATQCSTSENSFVMDSGVGDSYDYIAAADQFLNGSEELNENDWDPILTEWYMGLLTFDQEEGGVEEISKLGKRKFEEENSRGSKKMCL
ncbi:hypothetical protein POM88_043234 [Heracleum sosnowskyi]|uniref:NAC domain-containing protein n=1 Tax=Heracleum sosnowskyi TaxID=360622 RepID=A0AAD8M491_9APIA|nr:hypothetical protein POM88_043232 [Heracleum sosnowskyi]KAK1358760.1 hypothetical protein POM88_043234 [Heracleum sosnowskyi]